MSRPEHIEPARRDRRARRRSPAMASPYPVVAAPADPARGRVQLDEPVVAALQAVRDYPCASVLMSTAPGSTLSSADAARLDRLVAAAGRRLRTEVAHHPIEPVLARLARLSVDARSVNPGRSVALFASFQHDALVTVPVDVVDRVVVDPTFATRDLVRALAARPRFRVVVVSDAIDGYLRAERRAVLTRLPATDPDRSSFGIDAVWSAAGAGRIELLCVEEGFVYPARPDHARGKLHPDDDLDRPEVLDDAIDEVIEMVRLGA